MDLIAIFSTVFSAVAALAAAAAIILSMRERRTDMKEDFILWAIERLREQELRESRRSIYQYTPQDWQALGQAALAHQNDPRLDQIRRVCLSFDEIGYFVFKVGLVNFRDLLDMYPQTIKIWNKVRPLIKIWRETENASTFIYFKMLARQERLDIRPEFEPPTKLFQA